MIVQRQKLFARSDYEGLSKHQQKLLKRNRDKYAKDLKKKYREAMSDLDALEKAEDLNSKVKTIQIGRGNRPFGYDTSVSVKGNPFSHLEKWPDAQDNVVTIGDIEDKYSRNNKSLINKHRKNVQGEFLRQSEDASKLLRQKIDQTHYPGSGNKAWGDYGNEKGENRWKERDRKLRRRDANLKKKFEERVQEFKKAKKAKLSQESIAHHQEIANKLRVKKVKNIKNAKIALGVGAGALALGGGALAYKHYKDKKKEEEK